ncbi:MAG: transposase [Chthoniobacteraceae bacterium]|nr:transposase [Chthoniobacteraceae bacterium]
MASKVERVAKLAMGLGEKHLAAYGAARSRHDFTQKQLMACLVLRAYLKTTYRGVVDLLSGHQKLREALGMEDKVPHYTTLQKFSARSNVLAIADAMIGQIGEAALRMQGRKEKAVAVAIDATGMETTTASAHFMSRAGRTHRKWAKASVALVCGCLFPIGLAMGWGPSNDKSQAEELLDKSLGNRPLNCLPQSLYGDAAFDADWIHALCREEWGVESIIKPSRTRSDGSLGGSYRAAMTKEHLEKKGYGRRWHIESFFSGLKRTTGSALTARSNDNLLKEAAIRVLAYSLNR